jgi:chromosome segregation ATPase
MLYSDPRGEEMIIAIEDIYANLDAWAADLAEARYWARRMKAQRDDLRNESDKLLMDLIDSEKERDALRKQLDEWKSAHDNLANQLSIANDNVELAYEGLDEIYAMELPDEIHKYASELMDKIEGGGLPKLRKQLEMAKVDAENMDKAYVKVLGLRQNLIEQLDIAVQAVKRMPHNVNHCKHGECLGCIADITLAEIESIGKEGKNE